MQKLFQIYRPLALIVGVLLTLMYFVVLPFKYLLPDGTPMQQLGATLSPWIVIPHGWIYIGYVVVAALMMLRAKWSWQFLLLMLVSGLLPLMIFWVERRVAEKVRLEPSGAVN